MSNTALRDVRGRRVIVSVPAQIRSHAPIRKAVESYEQLVVAEQSARAELDTLGQMIGRAEQEHLAAFAAALALGKPEPAASAAEKLQAEHAKLERKVAATSIAIDNAETSLVATVEGERGSLADDADKQAQAARERVRAAVTEYATARAELVAHEGLKRWLAAFPSGSGKSVTTGTPPVRGLLGQNGEATPFGHLVDALLAETSPPAPAAPTFIREPTGKPRRRPSTRPRQASK